MANRVTWAEVKALFTQADRDHMLAVRGFDLWNCADVQKWAHLILQRVTDQNNPMPPQPWASHNGEDGPWSDDKVKVLQAWMDDGMACS